MRKTEQCWWMNFWLWWQNVIFWAVVHSFKFFILLISSSSVINFSFSAINFSFSVVNFSCSVVKFSNQHERCQSMKKCRRGGYKRCKVVIKWLNRSVMPRFAGGLYSPKGTRAFSSSSVTAAACPLPYPYPLINRLCPAPLSSGVWKVCVVEGLVSPVPVCAPPAAELTRCGALNNTGRGGSVPERASGSTGPPMGPCRKEKDVSSWRLKRSAKAQVTWPIDQAREQAGWLIGSSLTMC